MRGSVVALGIGGIVSSNTGCGSSSSTADGGAGTSGGGTVGGAGHTGGGTGGGTGGSVALRMNYTFDTVTSTDSMAWKLNDYVDGNPAKNLGAYMNGDAGLTLAAPPTLAWNSDDAASSTTSGSLKVTVTFTANGQYVDPVYNMPTLDLSNRIIHLKIRLVSGTFSGGGVQFHFGTGSSYVYAAGTFKNAGNFVAGTWYDLTIDTGIAQPATAGLTLDPSMVVQVGVQILSGTTTDGGAPPAGALVFEIDDVKG